MKGFIFAALAAAFVAVPASAHIAVQADISGTAIGTVTDYVCDSNGCTAGTVTNFSSPFTASINDDAPSFNFTYSVDGLSPFGFNSADANTAIIANGDALDTVFLTLRHTVGGVIEVPGGHLVRSEDLTFGLDRFGNLLSVLGTVVRDNNYPQVSRQRIAFSFSGADVTGHISGDIAGIPEPSTWTMMLLGFGAVGLSLGRRRRFLLSA